MTAALTPLPRAFYRRDPRQVVPELLGHLLVRRSGRALLAGRIVEAEAYLGLGDLAAHAAAGRTERNAVLYGPPGHAYVYFIYGSYFCLNVSCMPEGDAGCVLIRALEPVLGLEQMAEARGLEHAALEKLSTRKLLTSGPGRLCDALDITRERDNGADLTQPGALYIASDGAARPQVAATPRIGITKAVEWPLRYIVAGSPYLSGSRAQNIPVAPTNR